MVDIRSLISLLSDGQFHSGSDLGRELGVSRTAIWKSLDRLEELGLSPESIKGKGYRLKHALDLLEEQEILDALTSDCQGRVALEVLLSVDSTNQYVLNKGGLESEYHFVVAERQLSGRGRRGRAWVSPFGSNLYLSAGFDLFGGVEALAGLSLVVGIAVVRSIKACTHLDVQLKWPNDVWLDGKKIAGILVELTGEATTSWRVVVGVGVNIGMTNEEAKAIDQPWAAIGESLNCSRSQYAATLISELANVLDRFKRDGLDAFMAEWESLDLLAGESIEVSGINISGVACGIDESGALLVDTGEGVVPVNAGEVSVRPNAS